jgi:hypothetical protein
MCGVKPDVGEVDLADASRSSWIGTVKLLGQFFGIDIFGICPGILFITIAFPSNKVLHFVPEESAVKHFLNLIVFLSINKFQFQDRSGSLIRDWILWSRKQLDDMEDWVQVGRSSREFEVVGMGSNAFLNLAGSEIVVCKFLRWLGGADVSGIQVHHVSDLVHRCWSVVAVVVLSCFAFASADLPFPGLMPSGPGTH